MSEVINPAEMINSYLLTDGNKTKEYHVLSNENWVKMSEYFNLVLEPRQALGMCQKWFGTTASIGYETDMDSINTNYRSIIDNANGLTSKNILGRINDWWKYNAYDYSDSSYTKTWKSYNTLINDDTLGILCIKPVE